MVTDPAGQYWSPYLGMGNVPMMGVDPDGCWANPIYDKGGNFLGTDDLGLQGDAIIMNVSDFSQGMSHSIALSIGSTIDNMNWGTLKLTLLDPDQGEVHIGGDTFMDQYDFRMDGRPLRDVATRIGRPGGELDGVSFLIHSYGNAIVPVKN